MDEKTSEKSSDKMSDTINNICTILGGALLLYPIIEHATKTLLPEMQKLATGESQKEQKLLPTDQEKYDTSEYENKHKKHEDEISELKRKLAEIESKSSDNKNDN